MQKYAHNCVCTAIYCIYIFHFRSYSQKYLFFLLFDIRFMKDLWIITSCSLVFNLLCPLCLLPFTFMCKFHIRHVKTDTPHFRKSTHNNLLEADIALFSHSYLFLKILSLKCFNLNQFVLIISPKIN